MAKVLSRWASLKAAAHWCCRVRCSGVIWEPLPSYCRCSCSPSAVQFIPDRAPACFEKSVNPTQKSKSRFRFHFSRASNLDLFFSIFLWLSLDIEVCWLGTRPRGAFNRLLRVTHYRSPSFDNIPSSNKPPRCVTHSSFLACQPHPRQRVKNKEEDKS